MVEDGELAALRDARYAGWDGDLGRAILGGDARSGRSRGAVADGSIDPRPVSGGQERLENVVNRQIWAADRRS